MNTFRFLFIIFSSYFFINSCVSSTLNSSKIEYKFDELSFDVVKKNLNLDDDLPKGFIDPLNYWFNNKIKLKGFEGEMSIFIEDYSEEITNIPDGKKVEIYVNFKIFIRNTQNKTKNISGEVKSFSEISGDFSLNELDNLIEDTQYNLVLQLANKLSKYN